MLRDAGLIVLDRHRSAAVVADGRVGIAGVKGFVGGFGGFTLPDLGSERLAAPVLEHKPDLVLHGHAHAGTLRGAIQGIPVYNVSLPVMNQDHWLFELHAARPVPSALH